MSNVPTNVTDKHGSLIYLTLFVTLLIQSYMGNGVRTESLRYQGQFPRDSHDDHVKPTILDLSLLLSETSLSAAAVCNVRHKTKAT